MSLRSKLSQISKPADLFPELSNAQKETNRLLVLIANAIHARRRELNQTQSQLANLLAVSQPMVCQWEKGEYNFTIETLATVFDKLKLKVDISFEPVETEEVIPQISRYDFRKPKAGSKFKESTPFALEEAA